MPFAHTLILTAEPPWHWAISGVLLGLITLALLFLTNHRLGISTSFESVCALASRRPYFRRDDLHGRGRWRLFFLGGLIIGGAVSALAAHGMWQPLMDLGMFDAVFGWSDPGKLAWMAVGGLAIGFGTRLAGGCTSGHGIFGLANLEPASFVTTLAYMAAGVVFTHVTYRLIGGG